jgi:rSAM/selenodomain-associated transferase 1
MRYPILSPANQMPERGGQCVLAIMAKAPRAGKVKTRLSPPLTPEQSATLNTCFLQDTAQNIAEVSASSEAWGKSAGVVCYAPVGDEAAFDNLLPPSFALIPQRGDSFGERLLAAAEDLFHCGYGSVCLIDSDSPTVPAAAFRRAIAELTQPGDRIVLGPSHDGGYYLIGLRHPHPELFTGIHWSTSTVFSETLAAAQGANIQTITLPVWYDVDDAATLTLLFAELLANAPPSFTTLPGYPAPRTRAFLQNLNHPTS